MGLAFYTGKSFPEKYWNNAFVALRGSINRLDLVGYSLVHIPFKNGQPSGPVEDFLTGFIIRNDQEKEVWGRPVDVIQIEDGSLLISDDAGNRIFRVSYR
jgi:glucose/arabinose dehydrogenase